jgi:MFS family permease
MVFIIYGLLYDMMLNVYRPFAVKFLERVGGTEFHISMFYALPGLVAAAAALPGSILIARKTRKKNITTVFFLVSRAFILTLVLVPALPMPARPIVFLAIIGLMNLPEILAQISLQGFLGMVFDGQVRARAIALRNKFGNVIVLIVTLSTGLIISYFPRTEAERLICYQVFFVIAFLTGLAEVAVFRRFNETAPAVDGQNKIDMSFYKRVLRDKKFLRFLVAALIFQFFWQSGWPISAVYQVSYLKANEIWLAIFAVTSGVGSFATASSIARLIGKRGNAWTLALSATAIAVSFSLTALAGTLPVMAVFNILAGIATLGVNTTLLNGLIESSPDEGRIVYLAVYNMAVNFSAFLSPFVSSILMANFHIKTAILIVALMRVFSASILWHEFLCGKKAS